MLDSDLIINVVAAIAVYKVLIASIEFACLKLLAMFLGKQVTGKTRQERINRAINIANEELKKTELN